MRKHNNVTRQYFSIKRAVTFQKFNYSGKTFQYKRFVPSNKIKGKLLHLFDKNNDHT